MVYFAAVPETPDNPRSNVPSIALLGIASGLSVFGMTIAIPAISGIATHFDAEFGAVQFVISAYLFGLAVAQPVSGVLCDRFGRRRVMLIGFALFIAASLACTVAPSLPLLIVARFVQAAGVSVGTVATRAILRDTRSGEEMTQAMSWIAVAMGIAPIAGPIFGGLIESLAGYQWIFALTALLGAAIYAGMFLRLDETLPDDLAQPAPGTMLSGYLALLRSPQFVGYTLIYGFVQGTFFGFLAVGAPFFETAFLIDAKTFGIIWGLMAITYVIGAAISARALPRLGADRVMSLSMALLLVGGVLMLVAVHQAPLTPFRLLFPLGVMMAVSGAATPGAMAGAVRYHPEIAGTASGFSSAIGLVVGGSFTIIAGNLYDGVFNPVANMMFVCCCGAALSWLLAGRRHPASAATST
jgi:DHA1 family bicyclomycin/chloramphenicol resistance-like MFS transporter